MSPSPITARCLCAALALALLAQSSTSAQETPASPGEAAPAPRAWAPTIGFELKTTTHGDGPQGRTTAHSLMRYILPKTDAPWSEAERRTVDRWAELDVRARTKFFFDNYRGGHAATNFTTDPVRAPYLDGTVSWYESMNIPHIEVRSKPFDSKPEAFRRMRELRADVRETIAFHSHYRFPYEAERIAPKAADVTDWLRRVSWSIWLRRASVSSRSDFVLKSMDNTPVNVRELEKALSIFEAEGNGPSKDIIERRGIRVNRLRNADGTASLDIEFRGLMKDTKRIERYIEMADDAFRRGEFGPFSYDARSPYRAHEAKDVLEFYTFGWHGKGKLSAAELDYLGKQVERFRARYGIRTNLSPAELKAAVTHMATADTDAGKKMLMPTSWEWLFMPLESDRALPSEVREGYEAARKRSIAKVVKLAERVRAGEFGRPTSGPLSELVSAGNSYTPASVSSRTRKILHDFARETYVSEGRRGTLADWYEMSLFEPAEVLARSRRYGPTGEGFAGPRAAPVDGAERPMMAREEATRVFETLRSLAIEEAGMRAASTPESSAERRASIERIGRLATSRFELTSAEGLSIDYDANRNRVRVSSGLLREIESRGRHLPAAERAPFRAKVLGLMVGHELAHAGGIKAERAADAEAIKLLTRAPELGSIDGRLRPLGEAEIKAAVRSFSESGRAFDNILYRLKNLGRYGTIGGREANMARVLAGGQDPLARYRRADGTLEWKRLSADKALQQASGVAHFALALFLKELAVVVKTGDRLRIEEFFDGLMTTDFFITYGLFSAGAQAGSVAYSRSLARFVKPGFVSGILRTNVVLATGMALPEIVHGNFEGRSFAISVASLGLSSVAVKAGLEGIKWVANLGRAERVGSLLRASAGIRRMAKLGGWFYTAAETAVVLYFGDDINRAITRYLDERAARAAISTATRRLFDTASEPSLTSEELQEALEAFDSEHLAYRNGLFRPLAEDEALYQARIQKSATKAKLLDDRQAATLRRLESYPALMAATLRKYGSMEAYLGQLRAKDDAALDAEVAAAMQAYQKARTEHLAQVYRDGRRSTPYLSASSAAWVSEGARAGRPNDPYMGRDGYYERRGRASIVEGFYEASANVSENRIQAYDDEIAALALLRDGRATPGHRAIIDTFISRVTTIRDRDAALFKTESLGAAEALRRGRSGD